MNMNSHSHVVILRLLLWSTFEWTRQVHVKASPLRTLHDSRHDVTGNMSTCLLSLCSLVMFIFGFAGVYFALCVLLGRDEAALSCLTRHSVCGLTGNIAISYYFLCFGRLRHRELDNWCDLRSVSTVGWRQEKVATAKALGRVDGGKGEASSCCQWLLHKAYTKMAWWHAMTVSHRLWCCRQQIMVHLFKHDKHNLQLKPQ